MPSLALFPLILKEFHDAPLARHFRVFKTFKKVAAWFFWLRLRKTIEVYVHNCLICRLVNYSTRPPCGLLALLPIPTLVWEDVSIDFITCLPKSQGFTVILVVLD